MHYINDFDLLLWSNDGAAFFDGKRWVFCEHFFASRYGWYYGGYEE